MTAKRSPPKEKAGTESPTHTARSVRVPVSEVPVRISAFPGQLVTISATGALVRTSMAFTVGNEFSLHLPYEPFPIKVRVVRAEPVMVELPGATWLRKEYLIGLTFTELLPQGKDAIAKLCGEAFGSKE